MKIIILVISLLILKEIKNEYLKLKLSYSSPYYYIPLKFGYFTNVTNFIFSNYIPISFIPTLKCKICSQFKLNETNSNLVTIKKNIKIAYYHYNYTGNVYNEIIFINNLTNPTDFIGFNDITYKSLFSYNGIFSLSYLNYNFNTTKKMFALKFIKSNCELHLGDYENNYILNHSILKSYNVFIDENDSTNQVIRSVWYLKFSNLSINNKNINNDLDINSDIKLTFDIGTDKFHIPKKYFFDNLKYIFPEKSHCQLHPDGYFICQCGDNYRLNFGNFVFKNNNNEIFNITPKDYITYEAKISNSICYAKIKVNYENDLFIGGIGILKNYYSIFDIENKTFMVYKEEEKDEIMDDIEYFILFLFLFAFVDIFIFGIYFCWKKWKNNHGDFDEDFEPINHAQGESSEETD